jgi:hypothetical protein
MEQDIYKKTPMEQDLYKGIPKNTTRVIAYICNDARKNDCEYFHEIKIKTDNLSINQGFCLYGNRNDKTKHNCNGA